MPYFRGQFLDIQRKIVHKKISPKTIPAEQLTATLDFSEIL
jgi:hypothetical protein